jgi:EPS-associated MarR family transcriptional regulator
MASKRSEDLQDLQFRALKLLQEHPGASQRELAFRLGVSNGKVHYCIHALMGAGWVKLSNFATSRHHRGYVYLLTPAGFARKAALAGQFLKRKLKEYDALRAEIDGLQRDLGNAPEKSAPAANGVQGTQ